MMEKDEFTYRQEDIDRVKKLYDSAACPEEIANILKVPMWYVNKMISLIKQSKK